MRLLKKSQYNECNELYYKAIIAEQEGDIERYLDNMTTSATLGNVDALYTVGTWYNDGLEGFAKSTKQALKFFSLAYKRGHAMAAHEAGSIYEHGDGVSQDMNRAFKCYQISAYLGANVALLALSRCYLEGLGTQKNKEMSELLYYHYFKNIEL